jgi:hypothetical protein
MKVADNLAVRAALWAIPVLSIVPLLLGRHVLWGIVPGVDRLQVCGERIH